ncbi:MAG: hypothetical protein QHI38_13120, partial [Armatimonadota bacterium]|nr:hypothetical protein [Armatimonadota bacterium]
MKKLVTFVPIILLCAAAVSCLAGSYSAVCPIPYAGAADNRGIAVNKNSGSPYYGYFYGVSSSLASVSIWRPESGGADAINYVDTGQTLSYQVKPAGCLLMSAFVGPDDTVWVVDYGAKQICVGPPGGGYLSVAIDSSLLTYKPRSIFVKGNYGQAGTRVYVAEYESSTARNCEVFEFDGTSWSRIASLGHLGLAQPWFVTVDAAGNSYWANVTSAAPFVKKVKPDFTEDTSWTFTKPAFLATAWSPRGIAYVNNPSDPAYPEVLYISGYNNTCCIRCDMNGNYIDGYGNTSGMAGTPPAGTWTSIALSGPGGNNTVWLAVDDIGNTYLAVRYPGTVAQAYKFHLQGPPPPPTNLSASNDIYGQIRLTWTPPQTVLDAPTGYKIYRGTAPGAETYYATTDDYWKWKDSAQGQTPGTFYYYVTSFNGSGESAPSNEVGPVSVVASTAPAPRSLGVALNYSELNAADTVNNPTYDALWQLYDEFLTARGVSYTTIYDADPAHPNIENDDIAGYSLLILGPHRNMTSYTAQCIADYCKYSQGRVLACYVDSIADRKGVRQPNFALKDVYRANASTAGTGGSPWVADPKYRYLRAFVAVPEAAVLFDGLTGPPGWDGAQQWNFNNYLVRAYTDGTALEVA